jgi:hypothetical protein
MGFTQSNTKLFVIRWHLMIIFHIDISETQDTVEMSCAARKFINFASIKVHVITDAY